MNTETIPATEILSTTDYSIFQQVLSNREVNKNHVNTLVRSIRIKNLLHIRPILVNSLLQVIDGQHRLAAAEKLGVAIYYMICDGLTKTDISILNTAQRNWTMMDFINFFTVEKAPGFQEFTKLLNRYPMAKVTALQQLCAKSDSRISVRSGRLDVGNIERAKRILAFLEELYAMKFEFVWSRDFTLALMKVEAGQEYLNLLKSTLENVDIASTLFIECESENLYIQMIKSHITASGLEHLVRRKDAH